MFHPDDVVLVFTREDVKGVLGESNLTLDEACKLIQRGFDCAPVWDQIKEMIRQAEIEIGDAGNNE